MNNKDRKRDLKRPDYRRFLEWIEKNKSRLPDYKRNSDKKSYLPWIISNFPKLKDEIDDCRELYFENQKIKNKFNGKLVMDWIGVYDGKTIGYILKGFKESIPNFKHFILTCESDEIKDKFIEWYNIKSYTSN